jgi:hypothetical protein
MSEEPWRKLKVNDRIRIVRMPSEFNRPGYSIADETRQLYRDLIARRRPLRVSAINEAGLPEAQCRFRAADGRWIYHYLRVNDDGWVLVRPRKEK